MTQEADDATNEAIKEWMLRAVDFGEQLELSPLQFVAATSLLQAFVQAVLEDTQ